MENEKLFVTHAPLVRAYYEAVRIAQEDQDIVTAKEMRDATNRNSDALEILGSTRANAKWLNFRPDWWLVGFVPEIAIARFFSDETLKKEWEVESVFWDRIVDGKFVEHGDIHITVAGRKYRMDIKGKRLWGRVDNAMAELNERQTYKGDRGLIDGYIFSHIDREHGIIYMVGYLLHEQFLRLKEQYFEWKITENQKLNNGLTLIKAGEYVPSGHHKAGKSYWRIPLVHLKRFPPTTCRYFGDFETADKLAKGLLEYYPLRVT